MIIFIGYKCLTLQKEDCPYGSQWDSKDTSQSHPRDQNLVHISSRPPQIMVKDQRLIPRIIIQTNEKSEIPQKMMDASNALIATNPEYEYVYYNDQDSRRFIEENFDQDVIDAYNDVVPGAYKADLFRYCFLWVHGGVYIDMGMLPINALDKIIRSDDAFIAPEDNGEPRRIYNAFMACTAKHPIIGKAIMLATKNITNRTYTRNPLGITGPLLLGDAFVKVMEEEVDFDRDYGNGVRIIRFSKYDKCESGVIADGDVNVMFTRYPSYRSDQRWYNTKPHYTDMWENRQVFRDSDEPNRIVY